MQTIYRTIACFGIVLFSILCVTAFSQGLPTAYYPENNPEAYPWAKVEFLRPPGASADNFQVAVFDTVQVIVRYNIALDISIAEYLKLSPFDTVIEFGFSLGDVSPSCRYTGAQTSASDNFVATSSSTIGSQLSISQDSLPATLQQSKMLRVSCLIQFTALSPENQVPAAIYVLVDNQYLPFYADSNDIFSVRAETISMLRSNTQLAYSHSTYEIRNSNPLFIPIDDQPYNVDISIDVLARDDKKHFFIQVPSRTSTINAFSLYSAGSATPSIDLTSAICQVKYVSCPDFGEITPAKVSVINNLIHFEVNYTECPFSCTVAIVAQEMYSYTTGLDLRLSTPIPKENPFLVATSQSSIGDGASFTPSPPDNTLKPSFIFIIFPISGIINPQPNTNSESIYDSQFPDPNDTIPGTSVLYSSIMTGAIITTATQQAQYRLLESVRWVIKYTNNQILLIFSLSGGAPITSNNFPFAVLANSMISMDAFSLKGNFCLPGSSHTLPNDALLSGGLSSSCMSSVKNTFDASTEYRPFPSTSNLISFFNPQRTSPVVESNTVTYTFSFAVEVIDPPETDFSSVLPYADLSTWKFDGTTTYSSQQQLFINGRYVAPLDPVASAPTYGTVVISIPSSVKLRGDFSTTIQIQNDESDFIILTPRTTQGEIHPNLTGSDASELLPGVPAGSQLFFTFEFQKGLDHPPSGDGFSYDGTPVSSAFFFTMNDFNPFASQIEQILKFIPFSGNTQDSPFFCDADLNDDIFISFSFSSKFTSSFTIAYKGTAPLSKTITCRFPFTPTGVTPLGVFVFLKDNAFVAPKTGWIPRILAPVGQVGILHTRPYFLNQINFGTLRITPIPISTTGISLYYRDIQFRPDDADANRAFYCLNANFNPINPTQFRYDGIIRTAVVGTTSSFKLQFNAESLTRLQADVALYPEMTCSSIPLIVQHYNEPSGIQMISTNSGPVTSLVNFPPTYAMRLFTKLTPGRVSTITFTLQSSIPGLWIIDLPYSIELAANTVCVANDGSNIEYATISYKTDYTPSDVECAGWNRSPACYTTFAHALVVESKFTTDTVNDPKLCTFTATRRFSSPPSARTLATIVFPDAPLATMAVKEPLTNFKVSALLPAIGYLPPVLEINIITVSRQTADQLLRSANPTAAGTVDNPTNFDIFSIDFYNTEFLLGATIVITSVEPLTTSQISLSSPSCSFTSDSGTIAYSGATLPEQFLTIESIPGLDGAESQFIIKFLQPLQSFERVQCEHFFPYSTLPVKKPQTATLVTTMGPVDAQNEYSSFVYLPPVTSTYTLSSLPDLILKDIIIVNPDNSAEFGFIFKNTGKLVRDTQFYVPFSTIGLVPTSSNAESTFVCTIQGGTVTEAVAAKTSYSRLTDYTLSITPQIQLVVETEYTIRCKFSTQNGIATASTLSVTVSVYEPESGEFNLAPYTLRFVPLQSSTSTNSLVIRWLNPSVVSDSAIATSDFPDKVRAALDILHTLSISTDPSVDNDINTYLRVSDVATALEKLKTSQVLSREAYFRPITSLTDVYAAPGASGLIAATDIQDIATVATAVEPLFATSTNEWDLISPIFSSQRTFWTSHAPLADLKLRPIASVAAYSAWPATCFEGEKCGVGCPLACANDQPCQSDFECQSTFCAIDDNICSEKDFSTYPSNFFSDYRVKK